MIYDIFRVICFDNVFRKSYDIYDCDFLFWVMRRFQQYITADRIDEIGPTPYIYIKIKIIVDMS